MPSRLLIFFFAITCLSACKPWEDLHGPVSGVKVVKPVGTGITVTENNLRDSVVFSGIGLDEKGLTQLFYGAFTHYLPWEGTNSTNPVKLDLIADMSGTNAAFADTIISDTAWPQGRMEFYSYATNIDGEKSDSNISVKFLRNRLYPQMDLQAPVPNAAFTAFYLGQLMPVMGTLAHVTDDTISLTARPCILKSDGTLLCRADSILIYRGPAATPIDFRDTLEMPLDAQLGQLYRIKVSARVERTRKEYFLAPGFLLRNP